MASPTIVYDRMTNPKAPFGEPDAVRPGDAVTYREKDSFASRTRMVAKVLTDRKGKILVLATNSMVIDGNKHILDFSERIPLSVVLRVLRYDGPAKTLEITHAPVDIRAPGVTDPPGGSKAPVSIGLPPDTLEECDKVWRRLAAKNRYVEAADLIVTFLGEQKQDPDVVSILSFHAAQAYACGDDIAQALPLLAAAIVVGVSDWNGYVVGTVAFLRGDGPATSAASRKSGRHGKIVKALGAALQRGEVSYRTALERLVGPIYGPKTPSPMKNPLRLLP